MAVGWVRDAELLEVAAQDPRQGVIFYALPQEPGGEPRFTRNDRCLACHLSWDTLGVPGLQVLSMAPLPADPNAYATGFVTDHRSRLVDRWGGWYVTGTHGETAHMGNVEVLDVPDPNATFGVVPPVLDSLAERIDLDGYPSPYSDVVALLVLDHQTHMTNLITRMGWEARRVVFRDEGRSTDDPRFAEVIREAAVELVDYLLFVDEAPLPEGVAGASGFREWFSARGPHDERGRSLREISLDGSPLPLPVQLHDLHRGLRRPAGAGEGGRLRPDVGGAVGRGHRRRRTIGWPSPTGRRLSRSCGRRSRISRPTSAPSRVDRHASQAPSPVRDAAPVSRCPAFAGRTPRRRRRTETVGATRAERLR